VIGCSTPSSLIPSSGRFGPDARNGPARPGGYCPQARWGAPFVARRLPLRGTPGGIPRPVRARARGLNGPNAPPETPLIPEPAADGVTPGGPPIIEQDLVERYQRTVTELCKLGREHAVVGRDIGMNTRLALQGAT
jgi:hypothetical protein